MCRAVEKDKLHLSFYKGCLVAIIREVEEFGTCNNPCCRGSENSWQSLGCQ